MKEATEEAVYYSLFMAKTASGYKGATVRALPIEEVMRILRRHDLLNKK